MVKGALAQVSGSSETLADGLEWEEGRRAGGGREGLVFRAEVGAWEAPGDNLFHE